ncbi:MAG TPA: aminotransferase class IV, partial [Steroidobacteraceae bacterium]|nr:aminotransferase class IV [Steroidobacteraceae bacterium]
MGEPLAIAYLNGEFLPLREARVSPLDRAFLYGDGVYEVMPVYGGRVFRFRQHFDRLDRSLRELRMQPVHERKRWAAICEELVARNGGGDMYLYVQVTRGAEYGRNHAPLPDIERTVFAFAAPLPP